MTAPSKDPQRTEGLASLRSRFARQYLDKLINIEIPVPPTDGRAEGMIAGAVQFQKAVSRRWRFAFTCMAALLSIFLIYGAFNFGRTINAPISQDENTGRQETTKQPPSAITPSADMKTGPSTVAALQSSANHTEQLVNPVPTPTLSPSVPRVTRAATFTPFALVGIVALVAIVYVVLTRRAGLVVQDSPEFLRALEVWKEFIVRSHATPRAIKRFMNRVRCTAMRVHPVQGGEPLWISMLRRLGARSVWLQSAFSSMVPEAPAMDYCVGNPLRESTLVALTAIHDLSPGWLDISAAGDSGWLRAGMLPPSPRDSTLEDTVRSHLGATIADHERHFGQMWPPTAEQLTLFLGLMGSIASR